MTDGQGIATNPTIAADTAGSIVVGERHIGCASCRSYGDVETAPLACLAIGSISSIRSSFTTLVNDLTSTLSVRAVSPDGVAIGDGQALERETATLDDENLAIPLSLRILTIEDHAVACAADGYSGSGRNS